MRLACVLVGLAVLTSACSDSSSDTTTSTTTTTVAATAPVTTTATTPPPGTGTTTTPTSTTAPVFSIPDFTIVERTEDNVLVVAVPPGTYSDIDLQNLVGEVVERFAPVNGLHIVDDETITPLVLGDEEIGEVGQALLDEHYFLSLEDGFRMVFHGPFADLEDVILGS